MANFEYNYGENDYALIAESGSFSVEEFATGTGNYIRLNIRDVSGQTAPVIEDNIIINNAIFYASPNDTPFTIQTSGTPTSVTDITVGGEFNEFPIYYSNLDAGDLTSDSNLYLKPNEILSSSNLPQGTYTIDIDFLKQYQPTDNNTGNDRFIIKQISPSRKEVRLKLVNTNIVKDDVNISNFKTALGDNTDNPDGYNFKHVLNVGGTNFPIVNYAFDNITDGETNQSIVLRLYQPLPTGVSTNSIVTIEEEILITQTQEVFYFSDIESTLPGIGLPVDTSFDTGFFSDF